MPLHMEKGPFCQSCSMPLSGPDDFGTDIAGFRVNDYCVHCFQHGAFTEPDITMAAMIDKCVSIMSQGGIMPEPAARDLLTSVMPHLKRWSARRDEPAVPASDAGPGVWNAVQGSGGEAARLG